MPDPVTVLRLPAGGDNPVAAVVGAVSRADPALGDALHDDRSPRPYAVSRRPDARLDVICFRDDVTRALVTGAASVTVIARRRPEDILPDRSWGPVIRLAFLAPMHFTVAGFDHHLPEFTLVFGHLRRYWEAAGWEPLPPARAHQAGVTVERWGMAALPVKGRPQPGFCGALSYRITSWSEADRLTLWRLAQFGEWRGAGKHTSYGMGRYRILRPGTLPAGIASPWEA